MTNRLFELIIYICLIVFLIILYHLLFGVAEKGYGYSGYRGYHHHHSYWYYRGYDEGYYPSAREDSVNGSKFSKRGLSGGK